MTREEAIQWLTDIKENITENWSHDVAIDMAIEALSKPNYETDTEVRLAVTNRKKEKVILWDAFGEVEYYPTEALSADALLKQEIDFHKKVSRIEAEKVVDLEHKLADTVSVVRCKDCIWGNKWNDKQILCDRILMRLRETDFCAYGERKEE